MRVSAAGVARPLTFDANGGPAKSCDHDTEDGKQVRHHLKFKGGTPLVGSGPICGSGE